MRDEEHRVLTQLNPPLPMQTPKGSGWAHFVIDYGPEAALLWVVFLDEDGACWTVPNPEIRLGWNWTMGRRKEDERPPPSPDIVSARDREPVPLRPGSPFPRRT